MTPAELRQALRISTSAFYKYQAMGRFEPWELKPRIGPRRYSRKAVQQHLDRDQQQPPRGRAVVTSSR
jgi:hypothetical protein